MKHTKNGHKASPLYIKRALKWADELDINPKKAIGQMRDADGGRCCLCVAEDYAISKSKKVTGGEDSLPKSSCGVYFGWRGIFAPMLVDNWATRFNDGYGGAEELTHKQIATKIRKEYAEENLVG